MIAQSSSEWRNIHAGVRWRGRWPEGFIERNRRLYDYELVYFSAGQGRVVTSGATLYCREGASVIIPPGLVHCTVADSEVERWCIHFAWRDDCPAHHRRILPYVYTDDREEFDAALIAGEPPFELALPAAGRIAGEGAADMLKLLREYFMGTPENVPEQLHYQGVLLQLLALALTGNGERHDAGACPVRGNPRFLAAKNLIDRRYRRAGFQVGKIAAELQITPNHLVKLFRRHLGMSPGDYLQTRRLEYAAGLLRDTARTVREIAAASGFEDPNYFSRYFRKRYGITPGEWRGRSAAGIS